MTCDVCGQWKMDDRIIIGGPKGGYIAIICQDCELDFRDIVDVNLINQWIEATRRVKQLQQLTGLKKKVEQQRVDMEQLMKDFWSKNLGE